MQNVLFKMIFYNLPSYQIKRVAVIELGNKKEQNVVSYNLIRKIENVSCEQILNNCNLLVFHIIVKGALSCPGLFFGN